MVRIFIVLCGGTICTSVEEMGNDRVRVISEGAGTLLQKNFYDANPELKGEVTFDCSKNFKILSENMTIEKWNLLIDFFREKETKLKGYDGIIIAHGTDTLAYSSAMFSLLLKSLLVPVFFVSSNAPLSNDNANGNENFRAAVNCIRSRITPGVYTVYKNPSSGRMFLHLASRLKQCRNYEEDFYSEGAVDITCLPAEQYADLYKDLKQSGLKSDGRDDFTVKLSGEWHLKDCVLRIDPYVGLRYDCFDYSKFKAVLHGSYHSGTVCVTDSFKDDESKKDISGSIMYMLDKCKNGPDVFLFPVGKNGEIYASAKELADSDGGRIKYLYGTTVEMAYAKLLLAYSMNIENIEAFMDREFCLEMPYSRLN